MFKEFQAKEDKFQLMQVIISLYTTFIVEESIHPVGSEFSRKSENRKEKWKILMSSKGLPKG